MNLIKLHCTSLIISPKAHVTGTITAERVVVDESRAPFKAQRWCLCRRRMLLAISITNLLPLRMAPTLKADRCKLMHPMGSSPIGLAKTRPRMSQIVARVLQLSRLASP
jgi:hypothetical protein